MGTPEWNFQKAHGLLLAAHLPPWNGMGEDSLEEQLNPSPVEPRIFFGDTVYFRAFHGRYVDVNGNQVAARWPDKGPWQELMFCSPEASVKSVGTHSDSGVNSYLKDRRVVHDGDTVRIRAHNGCYISASIDGSVLARGSRAAGASAEFTVHTDGSDEL